MKKKINLLLIALGISLYATAESSSLWTLGLRGGGNIYMATGDAHAKLGGGGNFDLGYTCYWNTKNAEVGIHTGFTVGYCTSGFTGDNINRQFTNYDYLGYEMQYTVSAHSVKLNIVRQVQIEVPLMLALRTDNMFVNIGAKFMMPVNELYHQSMQDITIDAYYVRPDVHVVNRLITGAADESQIKTSGNGCLPKYNVLLSVEVGYEWTINNRDRIGLGIYADISPWSSFKPSDAKQVIDVAPIDNPDYPPALVSIQPLCISSAKHLLYCDFGVKFYYGINCLNKRSCGLKN